MEFAFSKNNLSPSQVRLQRRFEILPGLTSWTILIGMIVLSIFLPFTAAIFTIAFYLYWLLRLLYMTLFLVFSYMCLNIEQKTNWMARVHGIDTIATYLDLFKSWHELLTLKQRASLWKHAREVRRLARSQALPPLSKDIYHLVIFPVVKESLGVIEPPVAAIAGQQFPARQIIVVFALEEWAAPEIQKDVHAVAEKYRHLLYDCFVVLHPANLPGEARVKGANVSWAARNATNFIRGKNIPFENVIVSCFDADTVVSPEYFASLTYHFMVTTDRQRASFQPIPVYHNNIWQVPGFARVIETGSSFFQLIEATNPEKLVTFSSHSMSFKALVEVGYWPVDMISDDSAIFWKSYLHYDGHYRVVPMYVTLSMDVVSSHNWWQTVQSVYKQKRRWAWGVENFPIVMRGFLLASRIPIFDRLRHAFKMFEAHISWATWGFLLSVIGWMPVLFARREFASSVVYYNVPEIANTIFNLASLCLITSIILSLSLLPKTTLRTSWLLKLGHALEWLMIPFILVLFGALPALDAQTRLMRGQYLEFFVTDKVRKK